MILVVVTNKKNCYLNKIIDCTEYTMEEFNRTLNSYGSSKYYEVYVERLGV